MGIPTSLQRRFTEYASQYYEACETDDEALKEAVLDEFGFDHMGFDTLGAGKGRIVFDLDILGHPDYAVKFARPHRQYDGREQNEREVELWESSERDVRRHLAPICASGPECYWLVMPKGDSVERIPYEWKSDAEYDLRDVVWTEDIRADNVVEIDGSPKLCDYGTREEG